MTTTWKPCFAVVGNGRGVRPARFHVVGRFLEDVHDAVDRHCSRTGLLIDQRTPGGTPETHRITETPDEREAAMAAVFACLK